MKRLLAFLALVGLVLVSSAGYFPTGRSGSGSAAVTRINGSQKSVYHTFTDAEYLQRQPYYPSGGLAILLRQPHQNSYTNAIALLDSIRNGLFPDSVWNGADIHLGIAVDPESTRSTRLGTQYTIAEVRAMAANPSYEIVLTSSPNDRLGGKGVNTTRPSYGGVTGLSGTYVYTLVTGFQTWARDTAHIACPVSWTWRGERYMAGTEGIFRTAGIYQGFGMARNVNAIRINHDSTETQPEDGYNYAHIVPALFGAGGHDRWVGHHIIGEGIPDYNIGGRVWNRTGTTGNDPGTSDAGRAVTDSIRAWVDMGIHKQGMGLFIVDGQVGSSTSVLDMKTTNFRDLICHVAHRVDEDADDGWFESLTPAELAARKRGSRTGELFPHRHFTVLCPDVNFTNGAIISTVRPNVAGGGGSGLNRVPIGFSSNQTQHYGSGGSADTFATPGTAVLTAGSARPSVMNLVANGDSVALSFSTTDSTYGLASPTGNVIMTGMHDNSRGRPISFPIVTSGCDAPAIRVAVQTMIHSNITFLNDTLYVSYKYFQFSENWGDHMNEGPSSYEIGTVFAAMAQTPALPDTAKLTNATDFLLLKERIEPQFLGAIFPVDTTATGIIAQLFGVTGTKMTWYHQLLARGTFELRPSFIVSARSQDFDYRNTLGNTRDLRVAAVAAHETFNQDMTLILAKGRVYTSVATVPINPRTDIVWGMVCLENLGGTVSAAGIQTILDISVTPAY